MEFNALGFSLVYAITGDPRVSLVGGMLGRNVAAAALIGAAANQGRVAGAPAVMPGTSTATLAPRRVEVPDLHDEPEKAKKILESRGLVAATETVASDEPIGGVISSEPKAETIVPVGSTVTILVSAGLVVPDVSGKDIAEAESILGAAGFETIKQEWGEKSGTPGQVARTDPPVGEFADSRSPVTLHVFGDEPNGEPLRAAGGSGGK